MFPILSKSAKSNANDSESKKTLQDVIVKVTDMVSHDSTAQKLAKQQGLNITYVTWEDCARNKGSCWGPCISDMTLRVNDACMPVIRAPNYDDKTWDVEMTKIPIVVGNHVVSNKDAQGETLQTISLKDYLSNFRDFMTNEQYRKKQVEIDLTCQQENKDTHVIMSSQACFLPIISGQETKFNVALYNYQSQSRNPAVLVIVSTSKGSSAQIIEDRAQYLLFNNFGKKADFVGERVSDVRKKKGQTNVKDKKLSKQEKLDNVIVIVQVPLKKRFKEQYRGGYEEEEDDDDSDDDDSDEEDEGIARGVEEEKVNVEAAMVKVVDRTTPVCRCGTQLQKYQVQYAYNGKGARCDGCRASIKGAETTFWHCAKEKCNAHYNGYDLCLECGEKQLMFDELRGLLRDDDKYLLERDERYPVRCTLQYYKATDNGAVNKQVIGEIVTQLQASQKQADFMGSLVTEYNPKRPTEWVNKNDDEKNAYEAIENALQELCGPDWKTFLQNFKEQEVTDEDLEILSTTSDKDLDENLMILIPKMGPRMRFKKWIRSKQK